VATFVSARRASPSASGTGGSPTAPATPVLDVLQLVRREIEKAFTLGTPVAAAATTAVAPAVPAPSDQATTPYGAIGKWMLQPNGQISNYGGQLYDGKTLLEPVNVIIVDPKAKNAFQATWRLNIAMRRAGFPSQGIHSSGFKGIINGKTYGQQPSGFLQGYSNAFFLATNDHGRIFGPAPVQTSGGYVWSGTFSTEEWGTYNGRPAHIYVSSNDARAALAAALVASGQATSGDTVALDNEYNTDTTTTGDHDGDAVVLILT
jgi:hypothetical protein